jgi:hypothetical protein
MLAPFFSLDKMVTPALHYQSKKKSSSIVQGSTQVIDHYISIYYIMKYRINVGPIFSLCSDFLLDAWWMWNAGPLLDACASC